VSCRGETEPLTGLSIPPAAGLRAWGDGRVYYTADRLRRGDHL